MQVSKYFSQISLGKHQFPRFLKGEFLCEEALAVADLRNCESSEGVSQIFNRKRVPFCPPSGRLSRSYCSLAEHSNPPPHLFKRGDFNDFPLPPYPFSPSSLRPTLQSLRLTPYFSLHCGHLLQPRLLLHTNAPLRNFGNRCFPEKIWLKYFED